MFDEILVYGAKQRPRASFQPSLPFRCDQVTDDASLPVRAARCGGLPFTLARASTKPGNRPPRQECKRGINSERDIEANMQIGPTDLGMVRLFIEADGVEIPMDFDPEEAEEIAEELRAAAQAARLVAG